MDLITVTVLTMLIIFPLMLWRYFGHSKDFIEKLEKIPGPKTNAIFGNALELSKIPNKGLLKADYQRFLEYGPISRTWLMHIPRVHFASSESAEILLSSMKHLEKGYAYNFVKDWLGDGLLTSTGAKWHKHRKLITPTFHFKILETFQEVMVEKSNILVKCLEKVSSTGESFNIFPYITNATLDIICETAMGTNIHAQENKSNEYVASIYLLSKLLIQRTLKPWLAFQRIYYMTQKGKSWLRSLSTLHGFTDRIIKERQEIRNKTSNNLPTHEDTDLILGKTKRQAFLDLLLNEAEKDSTFTDLNIRDEVDTFMFEGHDTTTAGISWAIYLLGRHPEIQENVYQELQSIFNGEDRTITFQDLNEMKYLERVIKESLRLYPPVPGFSRKTDEDIEIGGYTIPAGTYVGINTYCLHRNPEHFKNPEQFNPDNFLPENIRNRHPYAYLPFSAGPRNCIGQKFAIIEEKTVLATLLRKFKIMSLDKPKDITLMAEMILRPLEGINVTLEMRK